MTPTDDFLIQKVKEQGDEKALQELIDRHSGIYLQILGRHGGKSLTETQVRDLVSEKDFRIYTAALNYDNSKSKFCTYLGVQTLYECMRTKRKNQKSPTFIDFDEIDYRETSETPPPDEICEMSESFGQILEIINNHPNEKVRNIFQKRYFAGDTKQLPSWKRIAKEEGLSHQGCIDIHNRTIKEIREKIANAATSF